MGASEKTTGEIGDVKVTTGFGRLGGTQKRCESSKCQEVEGRHQKAQTLSRQTDHVKNPKKQVSSVWALDGCVTDGTTRYKPTRSLANHQAGESGRENSGKLEKKNSKKFELDF